MSQFAEAFADNEPAPMAAPAPPTKPTDERYTPPGIIDLIVRALGPIAYDPCAPSHNPVGAHAFTCLPENGLAQDWRKRAHGGLIFVNSPFSSGNLLRWALESASQSKRGAEIVQLTPVDPSTKWYETLYLAATVVALLRKRPMYIAPADQPAIKSVAKQPAMLWYFGPRKWEFVKGLKAHAFMHFAPEGIV